jgi:predicted ArsR family transcriptional regulator
MQDAQLSDRGRSLKMPCDTRRVRELLTEGPCTPAEIAASLEMSQRDVACTLWVLTQQQAIEVYASVMMETKAGYHRQTKVWKLTPRGHAIVKAQRKKRRRAGDV